MKRHTLLFLSLSSLSFVTGTAYALPFNITASGTLPTTYPGSASYTVTNTTANHYHALIKYLPPNTSINATGTTCGTTLNTLFELAKGASCTLNLTVSGAVDRGDPNPTHHLTVCLYDGVTCAGPNPENSLDVTAAPSSGQYAFVASAQGPSSGPHQEPGLFSCPVNSSTGVITSLTSSSCSFASLPSAPNFTAGTAFDSTHNVVYMGGTNGGTNYLYACTVKDGAFETCQAFSQSFTNISAMALSPSNNYLYVTAGYSSSAVYACPVTGTGTIGSCTSALTGLTYSTGIATADIGGTTYGYVTTGTGGSSEIKACTVSGASWSSCNNLITGVTFDFQFNFGGIVFNSNASHAYVIDSTSTYSCTVAGPGMSCVAVSPSLSTGGQALAINPANTYLYVSANDTINTCTLSGNSVTSCAAGGNSGFPETLGLAIS
jgi:hypothetical protein